MVVFKERGCDFSVILTNVRYIVRNGTRISIIFNDENYKNIDCETATIAGNIFDGIINAKASGNEVYRIIQ